MLLLYGCKKKMGCQIMYKLKTQIYNLFSVIFVSDNNFFYIIRDQHIRLPIENVCSLYIGMCSIQNLEWTFTINR